MHIQTARQKHKLAYLFIVIATIIITGFTQTARCTPKLKETISLSASYENNEVRLLFRSTTEGKIKFKLFTLDAPSRLVIDFPEATFEKNNINEILENDILENCGFNEIRSSSDIDKARIVLNSDYTTLPPFTQISKNRELLVVLKQAEPNDNIETVGNTKESPNDEQDIHPFKSNNNTISVDFKDTDIQNVIRFLAEINHLNVVMSDNVSGTVTLRLKNVPWKQVLNIVLKTHQLGMEQEGNVVRIAPLSVFTNEKKAIEEQRQAEADSKKSEEKLQDVVLKILKVNFADIEEVASKIENSIISDRGTVETDLRTNSLIISDIPDRIARAEALLNELDEPVRQVMIEAKIVRIQSGSASELGVQWGGFYGKMNNDKYYGIHGNQNLGTADETKLDIKTTDVSSGESTLPFLSSNNVVNLPAVGATSGIGLVFGVLNEYRVNVKLSAMEGEGSVHILSAPKVLALNQHTARIGQGQEIPYKTISDTGTETQFKKAELSLEVTPTITNNNMISIELVVNKDSKGEATQDGPAINTQSITTSLLLKNGETAVVGGIIESNRTDTTDSVPVLGKVPLLGWLFKHNYKDYDKTELMIFITPKIIK